MPPKKKGASKHRVLNRGASPTSIPSRRTKTGSKRENTTRAGSTSRKGLGGGSPSPTFLSLRLFNVNGDGKCFLRAFWNILKNSYGSRVLQTDFSSMDEEQGVSYLIDEYVRGLRAGLFNAKIKEVLEAIETYNGQDEHGSTANILSETQRNTHYRDWFLEVYRRRNSINKNREDHLLELAFNYAKRWDSHSNHWVSDFDVECISSLLRYRFDIILIVMSSPLRQGNTIGRDEVKYIKHQLDLLPGDPHRPNQRVALLYNTGIHYNWVQFVLRAKNLPHEVVRKNDGEIKQVSVSFDNFRTMINHILLATLPITRNARQTPTGIGVEFEGISTKPVEHERSNSKVTCTIARAIEDGIAQSTDEAIAELLQRDA